METEPCKDDYLYPVELPDYWEGSVLGSVFHLQCTQPDGHVSDHIADGREGQEFARWKRGEGVKGPESR